jgi:glutathione S-transferase
MSLFQKVLASCSSIISHPVQRSSKEQQRVDRLAQAITLYDHSTCANSTRVRHHIKELNIPVTVKNLKRCYAYEKELLTGTGKIKVPCLRVESKSGSHWVQEYDEILRYLDSKFAPKPKLTATN